MATRNAETAWDGIRRSFPELLTTTGTRATPSYLRGAVGKYHVLVDPAAAEAMERDEAVRENVFTACGGIRRLHDDVAHLLAGHRREAITLVAFIGKDGRDAGGVAVCREARSENSSSPASANGCDIEDIADILRAKYHIRLERENQLEAQRKRRDELEAMTAN